ncbi:MAG: ATP-dependent DNA helicase RecG, partial [Firmicutes bacterium]|nr:ATP-dependent DNA helicase RecG [Bacillota bacterium]
AKPAANAKTAAPAKAAGKTRRPKAAAEPARAAALPGLDMPTTALPGVGPKRAALLAKLQIHSAGDLLFFFPRAYRDWRDITPVDRLPAGESRVIRGAVGDWQIQPTRSKLTLLKARVHDESGDITVVWFNQRYIAQQMRPGRQITVLGHMEYAYGQRQFTAEDFYWDQGLPGGGIQPIYPTVEGLHQKTLAALTEQICRRWASSIQEILPPALCDKHGWPGRGEALRQLHFPEDFQRLEQSRRRMAYEELLILQLAVTGFSQNGNIPEIQRPRQNDKVLLETFAAALPYPLTPAQNRVIGEIFADMNRPRPMARLVQGDVGCGKTMTAAAAILKTCLGGRQAVLMAPTEILAGQHFANLQPLFGRFGLTTEKLTGSLPAKEKRRVVAGFAEGSVDVLIGTHALLNDNLQWHAPGLAITDEQHRFGVMQRAKLAGNLTDTLIMSATPIPRTLAMTVYADLAMSVIDQSPPGRLPVRTYAADYGMEERIYTFIGKELAKGRQAFIICPLIEESEALDLAGAESCFQQVRQRFPQYRVGLLHGRLKNAEKQQVSEAFQQNHIQILVSTTVVEVGVDIPNATIMLIRDAERFGLAQLHQLRGRIGRGKEQGYCLLLHNPVSGPAKERLETIVSCSDGFALAEADLRQRGPGEFFGQRQHGLPQLRVADLAKDADLLQTAREDALFLQEQKQALSPALQAAVAAKQKFLSS